MMASTDMRSDGVISLDAGAGCDDLRASSGERPRGMAALTPFLKEHMPGPVLRTIGRVLSPLQTLYEFLADAVRYERVSTLRDGVVGPSAGVAALEAQLTKDYHRVEKGLSLPAPKRPFGSAVRTRLELLLPQALERSPELPFVAYAQDALVALDGWNAGGGVDPVVSQGDVDLDPGLSATEIERFFTTRRSVRNFDPSQPVDAEVLRAAATLALQTPSVCNRQAGRLHVFTRPDEVRQILALQNGNAGFRELVPVVAIVAVDSRLFTGTHERNQRWVDGGLFAMSFAWALHGLGLGSCMLNWSVNNSRSNQLRKLAALPSHEDVIVLMAIGHRAHDCKVARSARRGLDEVLDLRS